MSSINIDTDNIEKVAGTIGLVGYSSSYISLQAVKGIYLNGIGPGNTASTDLPKEITDNKGNFYISGQNGEAIIKSMDNGSIHLDSQNENITLNAPNGVINTNTKTSNSTSTGNSTTTTYGNTSSITNGSSNSVVNGASNSVVDGLSTSTVGGGSITTVLGENAQITLLNGTNVNLGGVQNIIIGLNLGVNVGPQFTISLLSPQFQLQGIKFVSSDLEMKNVQAELKDVAVKLQNVDVELKNAEINIHDNGVKLANVDAELKNVDATINFVEVCVFL